MSNVFPWGVDLEDYDIRPNGNILEFYDKNNSELIFTYDPATDTYDYKGKKAENFDYVQSDAVINKAYNYIWARDAVGNIYKYRRDAYSDPATTLQDLVDDITAASVSQVEFFIPPDLTFDSGVDFFPNTSVTPDMFLNFWGGGNTGEVKTTLNDGSILFDLYQDVAHKVQINGLHLNGQTNNHTVLKLNGGWRLLNCELSYSHGSEILLVEGHSYGFHASQTKLHSGNSGTDAIRFKDNSDGDSPGNGIIDIIVDGKCNRCIKTDNGVHPTEVRGHYEGAQGNAVFEDEKGGLLINASTVMGSGSDTDGLLINSLGKRSAFNPGRVVVTGDGVHVSDSYYKSGLPVYYNTSKIDTGGDAIYIANAVSQTQAFIHGPYKNAHDLGDVGGVFLNNNSGPESYSRPDGLSLIDSGTVTVSSGGSQDILLYGAAAMCRVDWWVKSTGTSGTEASVRIEKNYDSSRSSPARVTFIETAGAASADVEYEVWA